MLGLMPTDQCPHTNAPTPMALALGRAGKRTHGHAGPVGAAAGGGEPHPTVRPLEPFSSIHSILLAPARERKAYTPAGMLSPSELQQVVVSPTTPRARPLQAPSIAYSSIHGGAVQAHRPQPAPTRLANPPAGTQGLSELQQVVVSSTTCASSGASCIR